jgi:hypothetical protein
MAIRGSVRPVDFFMRFAVEDASQSVLYGMVMFQ